ncbi:hypothetical protein ARMGADRAFT_789222 [Armillaria gallica]|uniref:Uncharacterized protein n=1 Tax=Armillaria gallica TaxID=47427 RepID=A0A2H3DIZ2_ARMGA|nr:hypothetical protein ARMGADRAFT_789222 [Armillaria gallica]
MGRRASATTTSINSAVSGTSSSGRTRSARAGHVPAKVSLTGSATEDTARSVGADKAVEEIVAEEVPSTQDGVSQMQPISASRRRSSRTTSSKKHDIERTKELAPVSTQKKRPPAGPTSPAKRRKVDAPTPVEVEGDASPEAMSQADLPRKSRKRKADAQTLVEEAPVKAVSQADSPQTARRRKSDPSTLVKVEEDDFLAKAASQSNSPKTPRKRGPARVNKDKDAVGTSTPASPRTNPPLQRRTAANDVAKGSETVVDDQTPVVDAETKPSPGATATPRNGYATGPVSSNSPAKRKRRASVDGSPSKRRRSGLVKSEQVDSLSLASASLPLLEFPSGNTPNLWACNKADLMILTSKLNMATTIFVDQESAIGIAMQDDGEVELFITKDCSCQSALIDSLIPLDVPEAPEPPPKDMPVASPINLVDPHPSTPLLESEIQTTHASNPISSSSDDFPGGVNTVAHPSSTQVTEMPTSDSSLPGLSIHEPLKTCNIQASGRVSQHTSFEDLTRRDTNTPSTPSFPPVVRTSTSPPGLGKPDVAIRPSPSVVSRDQTILDVRQAPFLFGNGTKSGMITRERR